ncbi:MAG: hypothetical protein U0R24_03785 [Solirubrobacterales bacterium]
MRKLGRFAVDFVVGDDWRLAAGATALIAAVALLESLGVNAWWLGPPGVPLILLASRRS